MDKKQVAADAARLVVDETREEMESQGITLKYLVKKLKEELSAQSKGETAWHIRQGARKDAHRLLDHYPAERHKHTVEGSLRDLSDEEIDHRLKELEEKARGGKESSI